MATTYRQFDAGPVINLARHPRGTAYLATGQFPKWQNSRWAADGTYTLLTGIGGHPDGITTAVRFTTTTPRTGHGLEMAGNPEAGTPELAKILPVTPGEQITVSCWLRYTGTSTQTYQTLFRSTNLDGSGWLASTFSPNVSLPSGAWVRLSFTYTVPPGAGFVAFMVRNTIVVDAIGDTIDGTGLMVTRTPTPLANIASDPYATKIASVSGVFGWNPRWFGGAGNTGTTAPVANASDGPDGISTYLRKTWTAVTTGLNDVAFAHTIGGVGRPPVTQGESFTISSYFRASKGWSVTQFCRMEVQWFDLAGLQVGTTIAGPNVAGAVVAGTWHKLSITATAPAGAVSVTIFQDVWIQNGAWTPGDTIDGTGLMVTRTPTKWQFRDGNSPGWRWLGAVNTSESAGYPKP